MIDFRPRSPKTRKRGMADFAPIWKGTQGFEGGYQQLANDVANYCPAKGKPGSKLIGTKFGISAIAFGDYFHRCPTIDDIKNLSPYQALKIAKAKFWNPIQGDQIKSQPVAHLIFDSVYASGSYGPLHTRMAINKLMGPGTVREYKSFDLSNSEVGKINILPESLFFNTLSQIRKDFFKGLSYEQSYLSRMAKIVAMYAGVLSDPAGAIKHHTTFVVLSLIALGVGAFFAVRKYRQVHINKLSLSVS